MANDTTSSSTKELIRLTHDSRRLLEYVARHGDLSVNPDIAKGLIEASAKIHNNNWDANDEIQLIHYYDLLACQVHPVTVESIKAVVPSAHNGKLSSPTASRTISWYRHCTVLTLICLLTLQMFYLFGYTLLQPLTALSATQVGTLPIELEANYLLLKKWNQVWMLGQELPQVTLPKKTTASHAFSIEFFSNLISAQSFLQMLQSYLLPLAYGLLGAFIFVLRSLLQQVRNLTYTASREVGYRLRLTLGCLAGMITGWFFKPDMGEMALSPMALAFLAGYSIEILFSVLDKLIDSLRRHSNIESPSNSMNHRPR